MSDDEEAFHSADEGESESEYRSKKFHTNLDWKTLPKKAEPETSFGDGWSAADWDVDDDAEVMVTPAADRPPKPFAENAESAETGKYLKDFEKPADWPMKTLAENADSAENADYYEDLAKKRREVLEKLAGDEKSAEKPSSLLSWGGWNSWLAGAASNFNEGFNSVLESMESSLGAPTPEELARLSVEERCELRKKADDVKEPLPTDEKDDCDSAEDAASDGGSDTNTARSDKDDLSSGYQSDSVVQQGNPQGFGGFLNLLESTSRSLVVGSLDVMETIGKKTFHVLTEPVAEDAENAEVADGGRPHQRRRLKFRRNRENQPNLSAVLRELKRKADDAETSKKQELEARRYNYGVLFEEYQGMINLEGLEMLSEARYMQLQTLLKSVDAERSAELDAVLDDLKTNFDVGNDKSMDFAAANNETFENFDANLMDELKSSKLSSFSYKPTRLIEVRRKHFDWIENCLKEQQKGRRYEAKEIYEHAVQCLAEITAAGVEMFHKIGQLLLVENLNPNSLHLANITKFLVQEIGVLATKFSSALNTAADDSEDPDSVNPMLTNLFLEANNSSSYIRDASQLLLPVLQVLCIKNSDFVS